jgi:hypothetical protein
MEMQLGDELVNVKYVGVCLFLPQTNLCSLIEFILQLQQSATLMFKANQFRGPPLFAAFSLKYITKDKIPRCFVYKATKKEYTDLSDAEKIFGGLQLDWIRQKRYITFERVEEVKVQVYY